MLRHMVEMIRRWDLRRLLIVTVLVLVVATSVLIVTGLARSRADELTPLARVNHVKEEGVVYFEDHKVFLVSFRGELFALSESTGHYGDRVEYCPKAELFESVVAGSKFDIRGYYYGGPAPRGLDRYRIEIEHGYIYADLTETIEGPSRRAFTPREPVGPLCVPI